MVIKWRCKTCGALHNGQNALAILLSTAFIPVEVEEPKKEIPETPVRTAQPIGRPKRLQPKVEPEEEYAEEDLTLPE